MFFKKVCIAYIALLSVMYAGAFSMKQEIPIFCPEKSSTIKGAMYFKVHALSKDNCLYCASHLVDPEEIIQANECPELLLFKVQHQKDVLILTYHDTSGFPIGMINLVAYTTLRGDLLISYAKKRLDPQATPEAIKALIFVDRNTKKRTICFYDKEGNDLLRQLYDGSSKSVDVKLKFYKKLKLSKSLDVQELQDENLLAQK